MRSLDYINPGDSGLSSFNREEFNRKLQDQVEAKLAINYPANYLKLLGLFLLGDFQGVDKLLTEDPSLIASCEIKALNILNRYQQTQNITVKDIFPFPNSELSIKKKLSKRIAAQIVQLYDSITRNISSLQLNPDLFKLEAALPEIIFYYGKYILENQITNLYPQLLVLITKTSAKTENDELNLENELEQLYLQIFYYRNLGDTAKTEELLLRYRDLYKPMNKRSSLIATGNSKFYRPDQVLKNWDIILAETDAIQNEVERKAGLYKMTCSYFKCSDCCSNTFPTMTQTEFDYLKAWMEKNNYPLEKIQERAELIQEDYQKKFGKRLAVVDKELAEFDFRGSENPHNYKFSCPFLEGGQCSIYEARPLICRGFGLSSANEVSIKTCKYYLAQYQNNSSVDNERYVYDLRQAQMLADASDRHLTEGKHLVGTIVAWFSKLIS